MSFFRKGIAGKDRSGGAHAISARDKDVKKPESRPPLSEGKGQARSPTREYQEWKEISDLALSVGQEVGFQPDTSRADNDKDHPILIAKRALEDIQQMNKAFSEEMNKLRKNIEIYSTEPTQQQQQQRCDKTQSPNRIRQPPQATNQTKKEKDQSEDKKDHQSSQDDTTLK